MLANGLISITHGNMVVTMMVILWVSAIVSSFLDNIPFVATLIPMILRCSPREWMSLQSGGHCHSVLV